MTVVDVFGRSAVVPLSLTEYQVLDSACHVISVVLYSIVYCEFSNPLVSAICSYDGGPTEACSFPLRVGLDELGAGTHTVVVTVVDVFGQSLYHEYDLAFCK